MALSEPASSSLRMRFAQEVRYCFRLEKRRSYWQHLAFGSIWQWWLGLGWQFAITVAERQLRGSSSLGAARVESKLVGLRH